MIMTKAQRVSLNSGIEQACNSRATYCRHTEYIRCSCRLRSPNWTGVCLADCRHIQHMIFCYADHLQCVGACIWFACVRPVRAINVIIG